MNDTRPEWCCPSSYEPTFAVIVRGDLIRWFHSIDAAHQWALEYSAENPEYIVHILEEKGYYR